MVDKNKNSSASAARGASSGKDKNPQAEKSGTGEAVSDTGPIDNRKSDRSSFEAQGSGGVAILNGEIEILCDRRLPHFDNGLVKAYAARPKGDEGREPFFALICENHLVPRSRNGPAFASIINANLVRLVASGALYWPLTGGRQYCFIYENTLGMPIMRSLDQQGLGWRQDHVMKAVVKPMIKVLIDLRNADIVHGNICPTRMFDGGDNTYEQILLGECLSAPPSCFQPVMFEPIERALCDPIARGRGTFEDDLYSLGVSLAVILRRKDPLQEKSEEEIIREKIEQGSYAALTGKERFTGAALEILRGLLYDDREQRWTLDEILVWMDGQHMSPKQSARRRKALRPVFFNGERYDRQALLAMDINKNQSEAIQLIENGNMEQWIRRSIEDTNIHGRYEQALETAQEFGRGPGYWDRLLTRVAIALDPEAPIRYKGLKVHPEGLPYALAEALALKKDIQSYADIINQQMVMYWLSSQSDLKVDIGTLLSRFDTCRAFLRQTGVGYGIERCLYFLCPEAHCMSDKVKKYHVRTPEELMYAFEELAKKPDRPELFIDRHIAAFLSVKDRKVIDPYMSELNATEHYRRILGNLKIMATIQKRARMEVFPALSRWICDVAAPLYDRYHDRDLREKTRNRVEKLKDSGDLTKIAAIFGDVDVAQRDFASFRAAMIEYAELREERQELESDMSDPETFGKETGKEVAALASGVLSAIIILAACFIYFTKHGLMR